MCKIEASAILWRLQMSCPDTIYICKKAKLNSPLRIIDKRNKWAYKKKDSCITMERLPSCHLRHLEGCANVTWSQNHLKISFL